MLEDRSYMRRSPFETRLTATLALVVVNVVAFVVQFVLQSIFNVPTNAYFALSLHGLNQGYLWQLLTYQFMHAGVLHLFFNCWAIYVFGQSVEAALGRKSFLTLYFCSGIIGGLFQVLAGVLLGSVFKAPVVGASAAAFGVVAAFAMLFPDQFIYLFFVLPIRARWLLALSAILAVLGILNSTAASARNDTMHLADAAHLGGMLTGMFFVRYALQWDWHWPQLNRARDKSPRLVKVGTGRPGFWGRSKGGQDEDLRPEEFLSKEVDPILDKISAHGIQSLTERERRILEAARERMRR
jgi:membrane associated rhomboid family serine protease